MARASASKPKRKTAKTPAKRRRGLAERVLFAAGLAVGAVVGAVILAILLYAVVPVPFTHTMWAESRRIGAVDRDWVDADEMAPAMLRAAVAAEDANFCLHWGFDMAAIREALDEGAERGASTISQQVVKNVFLWQERSWLRKALEAVLTPAVEAVWSKRRILEVYLNVAEFGEGIFGVEAAARHHFGRRAAELTPDQAARLAVILPNPKGRDPARLGASLRRRAAGIADGAETIRADGRAACFED